MSENENINSRGHDEGDNAYGIEQENLSISDVAEKTVATTFHTGLKIGEAKEKLVVSKENTRLQTERKSTNFHSEKRNNRFQVDRLSTLEDGCIDNDDTENSNTGDDKTTENNSVEVDITERKENNSTEENEINNDSKANARIKKNAQRKMRERVKEQRKRTFTEERYGTENNFRQYYNDDFADFEDYDGYGNNDGHEDNADTPPIKKSTDANIVMDSSPNRVDKKKYKVKYTVNHKGNIGKSYQADNSNKSSNLKNDAKTQGLKHEKGEVKLKTDKKNSLNITLNKDENKLDKKRIKLRKRQRNNLVNKKHNLKKARLAHASAASKLIINKDEDKNNHNPIYNLQENTYSKQGENYAEQEQENLNKNVANLTSSGLKSIIADFEAFEANLPIKDDVKVLQKEFNKKRRQKVQHLKKRAEKAEERKGGNEKWKNENVSKLKHQDPNSKDSNLLNITDNGINITSDYSLNSIEKSDALNKRTNNESTASLSLKRKNEGATPLSKKNNAEGTVSLSKKDNIEGTASLSKKDNIEGTASLSKKDNIEGADSLIRKNNNESCTPLTKKENSDSANSFTKGSNYKCNKSNLGKNTDKGVNVSNNVSDKKESITTPTSSNRKNTAVHTGKKNGNNKTTSLNNQKNDSIQNTPTDNKSNVNSRLKHDKKNTNRKSDATATTSEKLKFNKENISWHEHKKEKLRHSKNKIKSGEKVKASSVSNSNNERQKIIQKRINRKSLQRKAKKNKKRLSEDTLRFGKKAGEFTAKRTLEVIKFIARLMLQKVVALILFIISKMAIIAALVMVLVVVLTLVSVIFLGTTGTMLLTSYLADDETLSQVSVYYSDKERDLRDSLTESVIIETYDVDEVNYILVDNIGHNSHFLLSYLTAKYQNFTFDQVKSELDTIFNLQYTKTVTIREVDVPILDLDGEPTGEFDTRKIADVTLLNNGFYNILYERLTDNEREHFLMLLETTGNRQYGGFPMNWDWLINITEDFNNLNNGVEAEVPVNTAVYGTINGEIVNTTADSVSIQGITGNDTIIITFSRLNSIAVNVGDTVQMTTVVGYTSDRIFIQVQRNGTYVNPVLFLGSQQQELVYGTSIPPLTQSEFNTLSDYASTAIGTPYVFGGTGPPPRGIDCSGFIWWAYNGSGTKSWGRTTAQGQFNQCDPITFADARPGDLIFFQGTYDTQDSRVVTHIGIYLGNGQMQHSGSPNEITSIHSAYWQNHFYSFGRLRR